MIVEPTAGYVTVTTSLGSSSYATTVATASGTSTGTVLQVVPSLFPGCNSKCTSSNAFRILVENDSISPSYLTYRESDGFGIASSNPSPAGSEGIFYYDSTLKRVVTCCDERPYYRTMEGDLAKTYFFIEDEGDGTYKFKLTYGAFSEYLDVKILADSTFFFKAMDSSSSTILNQKVRASNVYFKAVPL
ncbi:putative cell agglutination protein pfl3 [Schizosaccharomyces pombe]